jgi:hypothetical protein
LAAWLSVARLVLVNHLEDARRNGQRELALIIQPSIASFWQLFQ